VLYLYLWDIDLTKIVRNLSIFLGIVVTADIIRLNIGSFETFYEMVLGFLMRESEKVSNSQGEKGDQPLISTYFSRQRSMGSSGT
jgi:hypothetical protein